MIVYSLFYNVFNIKKTFLKKTTCFIKFRKYFQKVKKSQYFLKKQWIDDYPKNVFREIKSVFNSDFLKYFYVFLHLKIFIF